MWLQVYSSVFTTQGNLVFTQVSPPVSYVIEKVRLLTNCSAPVDVLQCTRNLTDDSLSRILLQAVAGDYITGTSALSPATCKIIADPITGYLSLVDSTQQNRIVLTIIAVVLFAVVGWVTFQRSAK